MSMPAEGLRVCILMEDGCANFDPGSYLKDYIWERSIMTSPVVDALTKGLKYPLMVKHPNSYGSTDITRDSRVANLQELTQQVKRICNSLWKCTRGGIH